LGFSDTPEGTAPITHFGSSRAKTSPRIDSGNSGSSGQGTAPSHQQPSMATASSALVGSSNATRSPWLTPCAKSAAAAFRLPAQSSAKVSLHCESSTATTFGRLRAHCSSQRVGLASRPTRPKTAQGNAQRNARGSALSSARHAARPLGRASCLATSRSARPSVFTTQHQPQKAAARSPSLENAP
jgi:hypothetical protein